MCQHAVQFYENDRFLGNEVARFVHDGLRARKRYRYSYEAAS
jgi:hypothetical protein